MILTVLKHIDKSSNLLYTKNISYDDSHVKRTELRLLDTVLGIYGYHNDEWLLLEETLTHEGVFADSTMPMQLPYLLSDKDILKSNHIAYINPFRYRSYYYDTETNLYYLTTRYYDPETGRFINADDISYADPETINGLNLFAYCGNNPIANIDPTGHAWWEFWKWNWKAIGIGIGMVITAVAAIALSVITFGAGTPLAMGIIAGATAAAGLLTGINGIATIGEGISGYNFMRDGLFNEVFGLSDNTYNIYAGVIEGVAVLGTLILGAYQFTGRAQASKIGRNFLGKGYSKVSSGRWVSQDGLRQMRIDNHAPFGKHFNLDTFKNNYWLGGRNPIKKTIHQIYKWFRSWIG